MAIARMRIACWITKTTNAHTGCEIIIAFPSQFSDIRTWRLLPFISMKKVRAPGIPIPDTLVIKTPEAKAVCTLYRGKGKGHPRTGHECLLGE